MYVDIFQLYSTGVIPNWRAVVASALNSSKSNMSIHLQDINTGPTKTAFDKIEKSKSVCLCLPVSYITALDKIEKGESVYLSVYMSRID